MPTINTLCRMALLTAVAASLPASAAAPADHDGATVAARAHGADTSASVLTAARTRHGHPRATYRHTYHRSHYGYYGPYRGYRGYGWYGGYWGWPYYGPSVRTVYVYGDRDGKRPGAVETDVRPGRAELRIDGELAGQARDFNGNWDLLWLPPGTHLLEFSRDGYQTLRIRVDVDAGSYYRIRQKLAKGTGLDPRSERLAGPPGKALPGPRERVDPPSEDDAGPPAAELAQGFLTIEAEPADAAVYLDGRFLANASELARLHGALPVASGEHVVEVVRPGFRSEERRVEVGRDETARVEIRLRRAGDI